MKTVKRTAFSSILSLLVVVQVTSGSSVDWWLLENAQLLGYHYLVDCWPSWGLTASLLVFETFFCWLSHSWGKKSWLTWLFVMSAYLGCFICLQNGQSRSRVYVHKHMHAVCLMLDHYPNNESLQFPSFHC